MSECFTPIPRLISCGHCEAAKKRVNFLGKALNQQQAFSAPPLSYEIAKGGLKDKPIT